jgi:osmoprotectant transport system permease protein
VAARAVGKKESGLPRWTGYLVKPVLLGLACLALYLWVSTLELDSIEQRSLNAENITELFIEHLQITGYASALVVVLAVTSGVLLTRPFARWITPGVVAVANVGQMVPSIGVLVVLALSWKIGFQPAVVALVAYSALPVLRNTMVGLEQIDPAVIDAARGMGLSKLQTLRRIELPLAVPVMLAGVRTALILNVGTVTLATFTLGAPPDGSGGLGELINSGLRLGRLDTVVLAGAVLTAVLALLIDWAAGLVEDALRPRGV